MLAFCGNCIINKVLHCHIESDDWQLLVQNDFGRKERFLTRIVIVCLGVCYVTCIFPQHRRCSLFYWLRAQIFKVGIPGLESASFSQLCDLGLFHYSILKNVSTIHLSTLARNPESPLVMPGMHTPCIHQILQVLAPDYLALISVSFSLSPLTLPRALPAV